MARTHDMDRKHMMETFRRAYQHQGASFVEVYQNCNVFNDGAFELITAKDARPKMLIPLEHGQPIRFGPEGRARRGHRGRLGPRGRGGRRGRGRLLVHDEHREDPSLAFALSRLATGPTDAHADRGVPRGRAARLRDPGQPAAGQPRPRTAVPETWASSWPRDRPGRSADPKASRPAAEALEEQRLSKARSLSDEQSL